MANKKLLKYAGFVALALSIAWVGLIISFKLMVDAEKIRLKVEQQIYDETGYKATIKRAETSFILLPKILFYDVVVRSSKSQTSPRIFSVLVAELGIDIFSIFEENPAASNLKIVGLAIDVQETDDGKYNIPPMKYSKNISDFSFPKEIIIENSRINYTPFQSESSHEMRSIEAVIGIDAKQNIDISASFKLDNNAYDFSSKLLKKDSGYQSAITLSQGENSKEKIEYNGDIQSINGFLAANGDAKFHFSNLSEWMHLIDLDGAKKNIYSVLQGINFKGDLKLSYKNNVLEFKTKQTILNDSPINLDYKLDMAGDVGFNFKADLAKLSLKDSAQFSSEQLFQIINKLLFKKMQGDIVANIAELDYGNISFKGIKIDSTLVEQELVINNLSAKMAGDTDVLMFGIVRKDYGELVNIDGSMEILGKDFQKFAANLDLSNNDFIRGNDGAFRGKLNLLLSQNLNLFSNIRFQIGATNLEGNVENRPQGPQHYNITLNVDGANLDVLASYIDPTAEQKNLESGYDTPKFYIPWLSNVDINYRLNVSLNNFNLFGHKGLASKFAADISHDKIRFSSVNFNWKEMNVTGNLTLTQHEKAPIIDCSLFISELDINNLVGGNFRKNNVERGNVISIWEDKPFNIDFMRGYSGDINVNVGVVRHNSFVMRDASLNAVIDGGTWEISEISGAIWGGELNAKGEVDIASILSVDMDFLFKGVMIDQLLSSTINISPLQGKINLYGNVNFGGISVANLIDSLRGQVVVAGRDVSIVGFDMAGMLQALPSVRNINDVANTVRVSLIGGKTNFSSIDGAFYLDGGILKSHGVKLRSKHAIGTIKGQSNLLTWDMNYDLSFKLPTLSTSEVAEISMYFKQSMDNPLVTVDSRNLESFMAKRKVGR